MQTPPSPEIPRADLDAVRQFLTSDRDEPKIAAVARTERDQRLVPLSLGISRARRRFNAARADGR